MATNTIEHLRERVRLELGDQATPFITEFFTDGMEMQYRIDEHPLAEDSVVLTVNGVPFTDFSLDSRHGVIIFNDVLQDGIVVNVAGVKYRYFNNDDLNVFCEESLAEHSSGQIDMYGVQETLSRVPVTHHHPIAIRASILALWALVSDAAFDIDIYAPDGVHIPRSERFRQLMDLIGAKQGEYDAFAKALNIGLFRIEVFTLRKVARRTNRLVPLYITQEYDDPRPPERLYTEISTQQNDLPVDNVLTVDLVLRKDAYFQYDITLNKNLTACLEDPDNELKAEILLYPGQSVPRATFAIETLSSSIGKFRLSLTPEESKFVPTNAYWQMLIKSVDEGGLLLAQGKVYAERSVGSENLSGLAGSN